MKKLFKGNFLIITNCKVVVIYYKFWRDIMINVDLLFYNGNIIDVCDNFKKHNYIAIHKGIIVDIGIKNDINNLVTNKTKVINLKGKTVLPGFIDSHVHFSQTGIDEMSVKADKYKEIEDFFEDFIEHAKELKQDDWLISNGFNPLNMGLDDLPNRWLLDDLGIENPIFISRIDSHSCAVNTRAMKLINIDNNVEGVDKNSNNEPVGIYRSKANAIVRNEFDKYISIGMRKSAMKKAAQKALKSGVTYIHALEGGDGLFSDKNLLVLMDIKDELPINLTIFHQTMDTVKVIEEGLSQIGGCLTLDGSVGSYTAAFKEPYEDKKDTNGILYYSDDRVFSFVKEAHEKGLQITTHCIGDRAIEQMLNAYENILNTSSSHRHRIEHFSIPTIQQIERAARLNLIISVQPVFDYYGYTFQDNMYEKRLGKERALRAYPLQSMLKKGILIAGGSDSPITPIDPLLGIHSAVNHSNVKESVSVEDAIKMFTINGAIAVFEENNRGSLERGKKADLVILDKNPLATDKDNIKDISVEMTILEGNIVYQRN
jgi:predicted amidohydrolase YtcJ